MSSSAPSPAGVLTAIDDLGPPGTPVTTAEVAERFDCTDRTIYNRLDALVEDGVVETKKVGARGRVWWRPPRTTDGGPTRGRGSALARPDSDRKELVVERILDASPVGILVVERDRTIGLANDRAAEMLGVEQSTVDGRPLNELACEFCVDGDDAEHPVARVFRTGEAVEGAEHHLQREADGEPGEAAGERRDDAPDDATGGHDDDERWVSCNVAPITTEHGAVRRAVVVLEDVTDRRVHERQLREERAIAESLYDAVPDPVFTFDATGEALRWNDRMSEVTGYDHEELGEKNALEFFSEDDRPAIAEAITDIVEDDETRYLESRVLTADGEQIPYEFSGGPATDPDGDLIGVTGVGRDLSDRKERERELEQFQTAVEMAGDAIYALDEEGYVTMVNESHVAFSGYDREELVGEHVSAFLDPDEVERGTEAIVDVLKTDGKRSDRFEFEAVRPDGERRIYENNITVLTDEDGDYRGSVGIVRDITERKANEKQLRRQRDELSRLNRVNSVIRSIDRGIVDAESRSGIEQTVCERIAASEPYVSAVIGELTADEEFTLRAVRGDDESATASVYESADAAAIEASIGPTAARTHEVQAITDVDEAGHEYWRETARERGIGSYAVVPIVYEDVLYGVLGVHAHSAGVFDDEERAILGELGETIGHAINAIERKEALLSDRSVEVEFRESGTIARVLEDIFGEAVTHATVDRAVPLEDGSMLQYATATNADPDEIAAATDRIPEIERVRTLGHDGDATRFEFKTRGQTVANLFATHGGRFARLEYDGGEVRVAGQFPFSTDVRRVVDAVQASYPDLEFVARSVRSSTRESAVDDDAVLGALTERQRTALEAAYASGYFEWPRNSTANDVADGMGISSPTFHKHLRTAERKVAGAILDAA